MTDGDDLMVTVMNLKVSVRTDDLLKEWVTTPDLTLSTWTSRLNLPHVWPSGYLTFTTSDAWSPEGTGTHDRMETTRTSILQHPHPALSAAASPFNGGWSGDCGG